MWKIDNVTSAALQVASVDLGVPEDNPVTSIRIGGADIQRPGSATSGETPEVIRISGDARLMVRPGQTKPLRLIFRWEDAQPGYRLDLGFAGGCVLATRW